jgi:hypothetical protein
MGIYSTRENSNNLMEKISQGSTILWAVSFVVLAIFLMAIIMAGIHHTETGFYRIKQDWSTGRISILQQGWSFGFPGKGTDYKYSDIIYLSKHEDEGDTKFDTCIPVRFNDGGTADVTVNVRYVLDSNYENARLRHRHFRKHDNIVSTCINPMIKEAVILTAAMMSSEESYTSKRSMFSEMARDQIINGIFLTEEDKVEIPDVKTGEITVHYSVKIKEDPETKQPLRKENPLKYYGIGTDQFIIKEIDYEPEVQEQIKRKREALMQTITAKAGAEKAIQQRLTAEEEGKKNVSVSQYEAEVIKKDAEVNAEREKEVAITKAQQILEVNKLDAQAAENELKAKVLRAQAEFEVARKRISSDGGLQIKTEAYLEIVKGWTDAMTQAKQSLVSEIGDGNTNGIILSFNLMQTIIDKISKDLDISLVPRISNNPKNN